MLHWATLLHIPWILVYHLFSFVFNPEALPSSECWGESSGEQEHKAVIMRPTLSDGETQPQDWSEKQTWARGRETLKWTLRCVTVASWWGPRMTSTWLSKLFIGNTQLMTLQLGKGRCLWSGVLDSYCPLQTLNYWNSFSTCTFSRSVSLWNKSFKEVTLNHHSSAESCV